MKIRYPVLTILFIAALPAIALAQRGFTATSDNIKITPGGTGTGTVKTKYECNGCTTPYNGDLEFFQKYSQGFDRVGDPQFQCDAQSGCSISNFRCLQLGDEYGCFAQSSLAPGAGVTITQMIKQQTGGPATGTANFHFGNDIGSIFLIVNINVGSCELTIKPDTLPESTVGVPVGPSPSTPIIFTAAGGTQPYRWQFTGLPGGLTSTAANTLASISGTPTTAGTVPITVTVTDSTSPPLGPCTGSKSYTLTIKDAPPAPHFIITKSVDPTAPDLGPDGSFLVAYTLKITNDGSTPGTATVQDLLSGRDGRELFILNPSAGCSITNVGSFANVYCRTESIASGASQSFNFKVEYHPPHLRSYPNVATVITNETNVQSVSNKTKINLVGILERFLVPAEKDPSLAANKGR